MENPLVQLLFGSDIGLFSVATVGITLIIIVGLLVTFFAKSRRKSH